MIYTMLMYWGLMACAQKTQSCPPPMKQVQIIDCDVQNKRFQRRNERIQSLAHTHQFSKEEAQKYLELIRLMLVRGCIQHNSCKIDDVSYSFQEQKIADVMGIVDQTLHNLEQSQPDISHKELWETLVYRLQKTSEKEFFPASKKE